MIRRRGTFKITKHLPDGEHVVSMLVHQGVVHVATNLHVYAQDGKGVFRPLHFAVVEAEENL